MATWLRVATILEVALKWRGILQLSPAGSRLESDE